MYYDVTYEYCQLDLLAISDFVFLVLENDVFVGFRDDAIDAICDLLHLRSCDDPDISFDFILLLPFS